MPSRRSFLSLVAAASALRAVGARAQERFSPFVGSNPENVRRMVERLPPHTELARSRWKPPEEQPMPDYLELVARHNPRHRKRKKT